MALTYAHVVCSIGGKGFKLFLLFIVETDDKYSLPVLKYST